MKPKQESTSFESKVELMQTVCHRYLHPSLVTENSDYTKRRVTWMLGIDHDGGTIIKVRALHGHMLERVHKHTVKMGAIRWVDETDLTNALFHGLTWPLSPYWFNGKQWQKKMEVMG